MRRGKRLVISGFVVAVVGIIAYCTVCLQAGLDQQLGAMILESPQWLIGVTLGILGLGTLIWLVGSFLYLSGAMECDPNGEELH